jgi:hypothetical protein
MERPRYCPEDLYENAPDYVRCLSCSKNNIPSFCMMEIKKHKIVNDMSKCASDIIRDRLNEYKTQFNEIVDSSYKHGFQDAIKCMADHPWSDGSEFPYYNEKIIVQLSESSNGKFDKNQVLRWAYLKNILPSFDNDNHNVDIVNSTKIYPSKGDFMADINNREDVFIFNGNIEEKSDGMKICKAIVRFNGEGNAFYDNFGNYLTSCRYATQEEIDDFLNRLREKEGKRWNFEKKCLEDISE